MPKNYRIRHSNKTVITPLGKVTKDAPRVETVTASSYDKNNLLLTSTTGNTVTASTHSANGNLLTEGNKTYITVTST